MINAQSFIHIKFVFSMLHLHIYFYSLILAFLSTNVSDEKVREFVKAVHCIFSQKQTSIYTQFFIKLAKLYI